VRLVYGKRQAGAPRPEDVGPAAVLHRQAERPGGDHHHDHGAQFREIAALAPFVGGARVATTSTTTGANLLVSGIAAGGTDASVLKYELVRPDAQSTTLKAVQLGKIWSGKASQPPLLGGD